MQQRVNNLWLSEQLIEAVASRPVVNESSTLNAIDSHAPKQAVLHSTSQSHRKMWQHLATALLLIGSAAFSYLAWSQSELMGVNQPTFGAVVDLAGENVPRDISPGAQSIDRSQVNELRVKNRDLQLRIAELETALSE
ncbi:hypothetical protein R0137_15655 [Congregibacter brevis]|uniref:Uncharacterized protein n=1 Tax=Congregibacter brevis TaxID=3081201 RepID=A0ABZ0IC75_9GAMM|nr:hypothetical protein R0137_15655 [Congregibacter sp. IMCC45268]